MQKNSCLLIGLCVLLIAQTLSAQDLKQPSQATSSAPIRILFIGNSLSYHNRGVYYHVEKLAESASPPIAVQTERIMLAGATLHAFWVLGDALKEIRSGKYDVVVLQEDLPLATMQDFKEYCGTFIDEIKKVNARAILFMHWDFPKAPQRAWLSMGVISQAFYDVSKSNDVEVSPVGLSWQESTKERPEINLCARDNLHPSYAGTYLAACTLFSTIFHQSPVGLPYVGDLDHDSADFFQQIAWKTANSQHRQAAP